MSTASTNNTASYANPSPVTVRDISQTAGEREIIKLAPDIIVYIEGNPFLVNNLVKNRTTGTTPTVVSFNDFVTSFSCSYSTDSLVPNATVNLQVPNHLKYLFQMPGGNNLIQPMMQIQVYAKGYYMSSEADTVYRRVFKGLVSHLGYNDNGKTYEISIQCLGLMHLLELMQMNLAPSQQTSSQTGSQSTAYATKFNSQNPYEQIAVALLWPIQPDAFQLNNVKQSAVTQGQFVDSVNNGYISKWQSILTGLQKDVHIFGLSYKTTQNIISVNKPSPVKGTEDIQKAPNASNVNPAKNESAGWYDTYYKQVSEFLPYNAIGNVSLLENKIVTRLEQIRKIVKMIDFEGYQDIDGRVIIKPPLYNLDVLNVKPVSTTSGYYPSNSYSNPLTAITPQTNPFVVYLSEILTEQETEDQSAIRRTRTTVSGNVKLPMQFSYPAELLPVGEYIDIAKLIKYGLREEPVINVPWLENNPYTLWIHAVSETVRSNRGFRTYTVTIPLRPELKLGFPVFFPHRDMYGYIKSVTINYNVGQTATMNITCDSIRRRFFVNTPQSNGKDLYTMAPNLVFKWAKQDTSSSSSSSSPFNTTALNNVLNQVASGTPITLPNSLFNPSKQQEKVKTARAKYILRPETDQAYDNNFAQYFIQNDGKGSCVASPKRNTSGTGYFDGARAVDKQYIEDCTSGGVLPYTDEKGYEVVAPFPWGRWKELNNAISIFCEQGLLTDIVPVGASASDELTLANTNAFLYAGLTVPSTNSIAGTVLNSQTSTSEDTTVFVLNYQPSSSGDNSLTQNPQPEDALLASIVKAQTNQQQIVSTLVSGTISPTTAGSKALAFAKTLSTASQYSTNTTSINNIGSTPNQQAIQAAVFAGTPATNQIATTTTNADSSNQVAGVGVYNAQGIKTTP